MSSAPRTVGEYLAWAYANLAMAHAAVTKGSARYGRVHFMIRAKLYKGLRTGSMNIGSLLDDERIKMTAPRGCAYCGADIKLSLDHLIPRHAGGPDAADNSVWACTPCNSSKRATDMLAWWFATRGDTFPPLLLIRRYLKVAFQLAQQAGAMDHILDGNAPVPFDITAIPTKFPAPESLRLWATHDDARDP
ncbi:MAG: HNH endonuclease [Myxococcota bacterium]